MMPHTEFRIHQTKNRGVYVYSTNSSGAGWVQSWVARFTGPQAEMNAAGLSDALNRTVDTWVDAYEGAERL